ncbi:dTDP-4-dehydrorhamnose reductase [Tatumella sp. JGM130]|uniref:dTDP-4-dehydrorhamnose reductase n=1 Tax=Tatumella sp. JGM130 TaxID=2799797 RepID=UPI001BB0AC26|nr:dTDP-4-dehydrorhamnose reductase [Tatumella sp. JGM130]MBS0893513.1 dTDP-4-dehydrorhamnose reductase [Tatumella sp. JGM130]
MKILLTGANGQLGRCFRDLVSETDTVLALGSQELDISNRQAVIETAKQFQPDIIINAAAYTAVDKAESEPERAAAVNSHGPENLALAAKAVGVRLVHVSTDYVFDGTGSTPYLETDAVNPLGVYGQTKLAGELLVRSILPDAIIVRTAWVFSEYGNNFVKTMLRLAKDRSELGIVADQVGCPTYAGDIATVILKMLKENAAGGIYHYCGDRSLSWAEFAKIIFLKAEYFGIIKDKPKVNLISTEEYPTPAKRPNYSVLSAYKVSKYHPPSNWDLSLDNVLMKLVLDVI